MFQPSPSICSITQHYSIVLTRLHHVSNESRSIEAGGDQLQYERESLHQAQLQE
jgi:hypothetical protein